jgi:hypothetical protein
MSTKAISIAALATALSATGAPALASTNQLHRYSLKPPPSPVVGLPGATAQPETKLTFPVDWRVTSLRKGVLVMREGSQACLFTVRAASNVAAGDAPDAAARALTLAPASAARVLESGMRNRIAWRVTRPIDPLRTRLVAVRTELLRGRPTASPKLWLQTTVTATARVRDECHSGTYRDGAGPIIGDALATARIRAFIQTG